MSALRTVESVDHGSAWFARRARNATRRPALIAVVGAIAFLATVLVLAIVPRQRQAEARVIASLLSQRADTSSFIAGRDAARRALTAAEAGLAEARRRAIRPPPPRVIDTLPPALIARRDSLARAARAFTTMIERVQNAPLPATYRALGEMPELAGDTQVMALLDSLAAIERERDTFGTIGGVDPVFVALTARATAIGREIQALAETRRSAAQAEMQRLRPPTPPPAVVVPLIDTVPLVRRRDAAVMALDSMIRGLSGVRRLNSEIEQRAVAARTAANVIIPPIAMLAAALIVGAGTGFGTALVLEIRRARVADAEEIESATGVRVLAVVRPRAPHPERSRRRADREMSALIDPASDAYRLVHLHLVSSVPRVALATVTGDDPHVAATVAANIATAASYDACTTLLIDAELTANLGASLLRVRGTPGLADILAGGADWTEVVVPATVGRDRTLDVIPSGTGAELAVDFDPAPMRHSLERLTRRYDLVIVAAPLAQIGRPDGMLPAPDVIYCVVAGVTPLADVTASVNALRATGARVRGIVLWDADTPEIDERPTSAVESGAGSLPLSADRHGH